MADPMFFQTVQTKPHLWTLEAEPKGLGRAVRVWSRTGTLIRVIRGAKVDTVERLFDEFAAALQFPWYFGENWAAFDECLSDLDWLPVDNGILLVIRDAAGVLIEEPATRPLEVLAEVLSDASRTYAEPIERGESWDRPAVPFHVVLHAEPGRSSDVTTLWTTAGADVSPVPQQDVPSDD